jgi:RNA polymerase sigma-70 factor (ECF subfamily)
MSDTSYSLLERLAARPTDRDWQTFTAIYTPILRNWLRTQLAQDSDIEDIIQETFQVLVQKVAVFRHSGQAGAFRAWLRAILANRLRTFWRTRSRHPQAGQMAEIEKTLTELEDPNSAMAQQWDREHDRLVIARLLEIVRADFAEATWSAFRLYALEGIEVETVAAQLGISENAVCLAKSRILRRLREEAKGMLGD